MAKVRVAISVVTARSCGDSHSRILIQRRILVFRACNGNKAAVARPIWLGGIQQSLPKATLDEAQPFGLYDSELAGIYSVIALRAVHGENCHMVHIQFQTRPWFIDVLNVVGRCFLLRCLKFQ